MQGERTGIAGFDELLDGGIPAGSLIVLRGAPGTGKTTFGLQFLKGGAELAGALGLFVTFEELPEQLYAEMAGLGWDLRALEERQLLRVIATSPDVLLNGLQEPTSILARAAAQAKRLVIDSVSLYQAAADPASVRTELYRLRSAIKRLGLTTILIEEATPDYDPGPLAFLADGLIHLYFDEKASGYRVREIEILKMRASSFVTGRHLFRIGDGGIQVFPTLSAHEIVPLSGDFLPTGIASLDAVLGGGIPPGATVLLDTDWRAEHRYLTGLLLAGHVRAGNGIALTMSSSTFPVAQQHHIFQRLGLDLQALAEEQRIVVLDNQGIDVPEWAEAQVERLNELPDQEHHRRVRAIIEQRLAAKADGPRWIWYRDVNRVLAALGDDYLQRYFADEHTLCRVRQVTSVCVVNGLEISPALRSMLRRVATIVLHTWIDGRYQYVQVLKSPTGRVSEPFVVQYTSAFPFVDLK